MSILSVLHIVYTYPHNISCDRSYEQCHFREKEINILRIYVIFPGQHD